MQKKRIYKFHGVMGSELEPQYFTPLNNRNIEKIEFKCTKEDKERLMKLAKASRLNMSSYIRTKLFNNPQQWIK